MFNGKLLQKRVSREDAISGGNENVDDAGIRKNEQGKYLG